MRKELSNRLLRELLKNSKQSDRKLAKALGVSQPTITRMRRKLELDGMIRDYTVIPDFRKMGFEMLALTFVKLRPEVLTPEKMEEARRYAAKFPNAILSAIGEGLGMNGVVISFHNNYTDYHNHLTQMRIDWKDNLEAIKGFIISLGGRGEFKRFSLTYLGDTPL